METLFSIKERAARFRRDVDTHAQEWLGCHYAGDGAYVFRVWAPHAEEVSLVGDFNSWDPAECPMERLEDSGIWEGVRAGIQEYDCYKYAVVSREGEEPVLKSDPYAYHFETRPANASKVYHLEGYEWGDAAWKKNQASPYDAPMNIYELHLGSWRRYPDGNVITTKGVIEGKLAHEPKGTHGFGYDPIFYLPERGCTTGELLPEEKNKISHRGIALRKMVEKLNEQA